MGSSNRYSTYKIQIQFKSIVNIIYQTQICSKSDYILLKFVILEFNQTEYPEKLGPMTVLNSTIKTIFKSMMN